MDFSFKRDSMMMGMMYMCSMCMMMRAQKQSSSDFIPA